MIPVYKPWLTNLERKYVDDAITSSWISSTGKYVNRAEETFAEFLGVKYAVVTTSGTTALHLCLKALGPSGLHYDTIVPNITFAATAFAVEYDNPNVQFAKVNPRTWNLDMDHLESMLKRNPTINVVIPVHLYGNPVDMTRLQKLKEEWDFYIVEDACESIGAKVNGKLTGSMGDINCFSFYGNKTFTSGEGGIVVTNNKELAEKARFFRGQAQDPNKRYWHTEIGHNYRMTNLQAAILCAQIERADEILSEKKRVADRYLYNLKDVVEIEFQTVLPEHEHSYWLVSVFLSTTTNEVFSNWMMDHGVDTRKVFYPLTDMPPWKEKWKGEKFKASEQLSMRGVSFPSYPELTNAEVDKICNLVKKYFI